MLRLIVVAVALVACAMLLGASVYDAVVLAPNFHGAPSSLEHGRGFFHVTNPGTLFRVLSPFVQVSILLAFILNWKPAGATRWYLAAAFLLAVMGDVITFTFHYPRNAILFQAPLTNAPADFERAASEWAAGNYVRIAVVLATAILALISLIRVARQTVRHAA
jgi:hypothetical protein